MITGSCITIKYWNFTTSIHNYGISLFHLSLQIYKQTLKKNKAVAENICRKFNQWGNSLVTEDIDCLGLRSRNSKKSVDHEELFLIIHLLFTNSLKVSMKIIFWHYFLNKKWKLQIWKKRFGSWKQHVSTKAKFLELLGKRGYSHHAIVHKTI